MQAFAQAPVFQMPAGIGMQTFAPLPSATAPSGMGFPTGPAPLGAVVPSGMGFPTGSIPTGGTFQLPLPSGPPPPPMAVFAPTTTFQPTYTGPIQQAAPLPEAVLQTVAGSFPSTQAPGGQQQYFVAAQSFELTRLTAPQRIPETGLLLPVSQAGTIPDTPVIAPTGPELADPRAHLQKRAQISKAGKQLKGALSERFFAVNITRTFIRLSSDRDVEKEKVVYLTDPTIRHRSGANELSGTLNDPVMGPSEVCDVCNTCGGDITTCTGHYGAILFREGLRESGAPVLIYHPFFFDYTIMLLEAVCRNCSRIVIGNTSAQAVRYTGTTKLSMLAKMGREKRCVNPTCRGYQNPPIAKLESKQGNNPQILEVHPDKTKVPMPIERVWAIIDRIDPEASYLNPPAKFQAAIGNVPQTLSKHIEADINQFAGRSEQERDEEIARRKEILALLGFTYERGAVKGTNPRAYILQSLLVLPPKYRLARHVGTEYQPHEFTVKYADIMIELRRLASAPPEDKGDIKIKLIGRVRRLFLNTQTSSSPQRSISVSSSLNRKRGALRRDAQGKSVGEAARSVIDPDPNLPLGVVSVPDRIAKELSIPVKVTIRNLPILQAWIHQDIVLQMTPADSIAGRGIKFRDDIQTAKDAMILQVGDMVCRQLRKGDRVIYYRAPTLHRHSLLMYTIDIHKGHNFRQAVTGLTGHNADFDGDEMSLAVLKSIEAQVEAEILMSQTRFLISARASDPIAGPFYDAITAAARMTEPDVSFDLGQFMDMMMLLTYPVDMESLMSRAARARTALKEEWQARRQKKIEMMAAMGLTLEEKEYEEARFPGWLVFSAVLPSTFTWAGKEVVIKTKEKWQDFPDKVPRYQKVKMDVKRRTRVVHGILYGGIVVKSMFGIASESFVQQLALGYSTERAVRFINDITRITDYAFSQLGIEVGPGDLTYSDPEYRAQILENRVALQKASQGWIPPVRAYTTDDRILKEQEQFEKETLAEAQAASARADNIVDRTFGMERSFVYMTRIEAKGNLRNSAQMFATVGQSTLTDGRLQPQITRNQRCSVWYGVGDYAADTQGYCYPSLMEGLSIADYASHQTAGRKSLTQMSNSTQRVGHLRRMLRTSMESMIIAGDLSLRVSEDVIVQHLTGSTGWDPSQLRKVPTRYGMVTTFFNAKELANKLNAELGF